MKYKNIYNTILGTLLMITVMTSVFSILPKNVHAVFNKAINYQGKLTNTSNVAVADGTYAMEFKLYTQLSGGAAIWTETLTGSNEVTVTNGLFSVMLGSTTPFTGVDFNQTLYLGINIEGDGEMSPRKILGAVPAAFIAENANTLQGIDATRFIRSDASNSTSTVSTFLTVIQTGAGKIAEFFGQASASVLSILSNGNVGIGTTTPYARLSVAGNGVFDNYVLSSYFTATSTATSTFGGSIDVTEVATSSFAGGINLTSGCFAVNNVCVSAGVGSYGDADVNAYIHASTTIPKTYTANTFTALQNFTNASSSLFSVFNTLYVGGSATSTLQGNTTGTSTLQGFLNVLGTNSTSTFSGGVATNLLNVTSGTASSTFANGINLSAGCFAINGTCVGAGTGSGTVNSGAQYQVAFYDTNGTAVSGTSTLVLRDEKIGIGTTSPYSRLSVEGFGTGTGRAFTVSDSADVERFSVLDNGTVRVFGDVQTSRDVTNTYFGVGAGSNEVLNGGSNVAIGYNAFSSNSGSGGYGYENVAIGGESLAALNATNGSNGFGNVAVGYRSMMSSVLGQDNTILGNRGLEDLTDGDGNIAIGSGAGASHTSGSNNIIIGYNINVPNTTGSNQLNIGNLIFGTSLDTGTGVSTGNIGIGTTTPYAKLSVVGEVVAANFTATTTATSTFGGSIAVTEVATSSFAGGINLTSGCFAVNNVCVGAGVGSYGDADVNAYIHASTTIPKTYTANTFTALQNFTNASSSLFSIFNTLYVGGSATSTLQGNTTGTSTLQGFLNVAGTNSTSTFSGNLAAASTSVVNLRSTGRSTSTFAGGINLSNGCFSINNVCVGSGITSSQWTTSGSDIYYNTGEVGIGTSTPLGKLSTLNDAAPEASPEVTMNGILGSTYNAGDTIDYRVYSYKVMDGTTYYSPTYYASSTINIQTTGDGIEFIIVPPSNPVDGYRILRDYNSGGLNEYYDTTSTTFNDDGTIWSAGFSVSPNFFPVYTQVGYLTYGLHTTGDIYTASNLTAAYASTTAISATSVCISTDCRTSWPVGGGSGGGSWSTTTSQVVGRLINYANEPTDIVAIGSNSTTTAEYFFDPNTTTAYLSGKVGIGTTTPGTELSIGNTGANTINLSPTATSTFGSGINLRTGCFAINGTCVGGGAGSGTVNSGTTGQIAYYNANGTAVIGTSTLFISTAGKVGVGTTSPASKLTVQSGLSSGVTPNADAVAFIDSSSNTYLQLAGGASSITGVMFNGGLTNSLYYNAANSIFALNSNGSGALFVNSEGKTGVGISSVFPARLAVYDPSGDVVAFGRDAANLNDLRITSTGNVGLGTTTPYARLSVVGEVVAANFTATTTATSTFGGSIAVTEVATSSFAGGINVLSGCFSINNVCVGGGTGSSQWTTAGSDIHYNTGNVGIGTSSPYKKLSVAGEAIFEGSVMLPGINSTTTLAATGTGIYFYTPTVTAANGGAAAAQVNPNGGFQVNTSTNGNAYLSVDTAGGANLSLISGEAFGTILSFVSQQYPHWTIVQNDSFANDLRINRQPASSGYTDVNVMTFGHETGNVGIGTTSPYAALSVVGATGVVADKFTATSTTASSTFANGINLTGGCYAVNGTCLSASTGTTGSGVTGAMTYWTSSGTIGATTSPTVSSITATSTTATSTFAGAVKIGSGNLLPAAPFQIGGTLDSYLQANIQNLSSGTSASSDWIATNNIGTDSTYYVDLGINSSNYSNSSYTITGPNDAYLYAQSNALAIGTATSSPLGVIKFHTGGTLAENERMRIDVNGRIGIGTTSPYAKLSVVGDVVAANFTATSTTATSTFYGGLIGNGLSIFDNVEFGALSFDTDAGSVSWMDLPVSASAPSGTVESYSAQLDSNSIFTIYGQADGAGGIAKVRSVFGTTTNAVLTSTNIPYGSVLISDGALCVDNGAGNTCASSARTRGGIYAETSSVSGLDLAEIYPTTDPTLGAGDILMLDTSNTEFVSKYAINASSTASTSPELFGVVSTAPGLILGGFTDDKALLGTRVAVALAGRVPVKISLENGPIMIGDKIAPSSIPGVAMKANANSEVTLGSALENFNGLGTSTTISVFVDVQKTHATEFNSIKGRLSILEAIAGSSSFASSTGTSTPGSSNSNSSSANALTIDEIKAIASSTASTVASSLSSTTISNIVASSLESFTLSTSTLENLASSTSSTLASSTPFITTVANAVKDMLQSMGEWVLEKITAKVAIFERVETQVAAITKGLEITDQATGELYCVVIKNGEWDKGLGDCSSLASSTPELIEEEEEEIPENVPPVVIETPETGTSTPEGGDDNATSTEETVEEAPEEDTGGGSEEVIEETPSEEGTPQDDAGEESTPSEDAPEETEGDSAPEDSSSESDSSESDSSGSESASSESTSSESSSDSSGSDSSSSDSSSSDSSSSESSS